MAIKKKQITPRQKMINLMYVILMAMLALNISTEVLNGFSIVEESINRTTANSAEENSALYARFEQQMKTNPEKVSQWFAKAMAVKQMSDSLYAFSQQLKEQIVAEADGKDADLANIKNKDNLEAASHVMLAPITGKGGALFAAINHYRERILTMVTDERQRKIISSNLTTQLPRGAHAMGKNWRQPSPCSPSCRATCATPRVRCSIRSFPTSTSRISASTGLRLLSSPSPRPSSAATPSMPAS